jgi:predicted site-specific integrase-resolvase
MNETYMATGEILLLLGISAGTLTKYIRDGLFPAATHFRGSRHFWHVDAVADALDRLRQPRPIADRVATLPVTFEQR